MQGNEATNRLLSAENMKRRKILLKRVDIKRTEIIKTEDND